ncbi:MAG: T9SS C-terminal target domain-containing protein [Bacteroidetes bacterium]|nr:MAG: T9SS C-terminal target domain-containing protein [Bacteroidota bacterium]
MRFFFFTFIFLCSLPTLVAQNYTSWIVGNSADSPAVPQQGLLLAGGGTDNDNAMRWFLQRAQGGDVVVIRASGSNGYNDYLMTELGILVHSVETLLIPSRSAAEQAYVAQQIRNAEALFIAGGDQYQYYQYWKDTPVEEAINYLLQEKKAVVGGTSAGMMVLGKAYYAPSSNGVTSNEAMLNPYHANMNLLGKNDFLNAPFMQNTLNDTHFDQRTRGGRLMAFLARMETDWRVNSRGIACNETTAIAVDATGKARVYGTSTEYAYFLQSNGEYPNSVPETCRNGQPLKWYLGGKAVKVYKVSGTTTGANFFELGTWRTGEGGSWENWHIQNSTLSKVPTTELPVLPAGELQMKQSTTHLSHNGEFQMGYAIVGQTPLSKTFTIQNTGEGGLQLQPPTVDNPLFTIENAYNAQTLPAGDSLTFAVKYMPTTEIGSEAFLQIPSNDADENPYRLRLLAIGFATAIEDSTWWKDKINISPNPTQGDLTVSFQDTKGKNIVLLLKDAQGKLVHQTQTKERAVLPTQSLPSGVYYLQAQVGKRKSVFVVVKQ